MRELSIFIDESGDFGPLEKHAPFYIISVVLHDQSYDISRHLDTIHDALISRGLPADHAVHTGPLIRREAEYKWMEMAARRSIFRVIVDFVRTCDVRHHSWVYAKKDVTGADQLVTLMSRDLGAFIRENYSYFQAWDRIVIYYDSGQKELTNLVNSVFSSHLSNVEVRKVVPSDYSLFQAADLICTLALLRKKIESGGLSESEQSFFSTPKDRAERALKKGYLKTVEAKRFGS